MLRTEQIRIADIPNAVIDVATDQISRCTVALLRCDIDRNTERCRLIGTGTLIAIDNRSVILTAAHVISQLNKGCFLGIISSFQGRQERIRYQFQHLTLHRIGNSKNDAEGPDIGLIVLPAQAIGYLKSEKVFYNINKRERIYSVTPLDVKTGFWLTCGFPGEWEQTRPTDRYEGVIKSYGALCGSSGVSNEYSTGEYDYLEIKVDCSAANLEMPSSFGGLSGAGIWQIPLVKNDLGVITPDDFILSGVAFYQTGMLNEWRSLRCHGRRTVYNTVPNYLRSR
jgi:hypothetical protein